MQFLSSKNVMRLETAFAYILDSNRVKEGEQMLEDMKKEKDFQVALATFISRSQQYNQRLLAILQLEKKLIVEHLQTVWSLREVYFRDSDKIAHKIRKIVTVKENIRFASEFLVAEKNQTGSSIYRQVEVVFHMLKQEDKALVAIQHHFELLCRYFQTVIGSLGADEDCFFLVLACLLLFYDGCAKGGFEEHKEAVLLHWAKIKNTIDCNCDNAHLIVQTINHILYQRSINPRPLAFFNLLNQSHSKTNPFKIAYLCSTLQIIMQTHQLDENQAARVEFITAMMRLRKAKIKQMLINIKLYGDIEVQLNSQLQLQDNNETILRRQCNNFIEVIFTHHQQWLQSYLQRSKQSLQIILTLANYYHSITLPSLAPMIPSLLEKVIDEFGLIIRHHQKFAQNDIDACITFIQFLNTFKAQIQLSSLPNIVSMLIEASSLCSNLQPFCDSFVCDIWKELAYVPYDQLTVWMGSQLEKINSNEWGARLKSYEGFLNLAVYIEEAFHHFSTCTEDDRLLEVLGKSHSIMCEIMRENNTVKIDFELLRVLLGVTCSILENERFKRSKKMHEQLSIPFLVSLIEKHLLLDEDTAVIVAFHRYHTNQLIASLREETKEWVIDQLDYEYRIQLYITELDYAEQLLPEEQLQKMKHSLEEKIYAFLNSPQTSLPSQTKSDRLWVSLEHHYGITRHKTEMMDIQS